MNILRKLQWLFLSLCVFLLFMFTVGGVLFSESSSGGALAGFMTVTALSAMLWVPVALVTGVWSLYVDRASLRNMAGWLQHPASYVVTFMCVLLVLIFS